MISVRSRRSRTGMSRVITVRILSRESSHSERSYCCILLCAIVCVCEHGFDKVRPSPPRGNDLDQLSKASEVGGPIHMAATLITFAKYHKNDKGIERNSRLGGSPRPVRALPQTIFAPSREPRLAVDAAQSLESRFRPA